MEETQCPTCNGNSILERKIEGTKDGYPCTCLVCGSKFIQKPKDKE